jgi:hypothetical protein
VPEIIPVVLLSFGVLCMVAALGLRFALWCIYGA